ncbi:MAG TPA: hypothetical protein VKA67_06745, partial [Verrucomicrobiae bacterium]|nr:hypothetical protein [Verrucomicrobiae bacterium]
MKTIYLILCFTCLGFWTGLAQAADTNNYGQALREALQRAERRMTNASGGDVPSVPSQPAKENSNAPAAPPAHTVPVPSPKAVIPPAASTSPANANANPAGVPSLPSFPKPAPANMSSVPQPGARPPVASQTAKPAPAASAESEEMVPAGIINFSGVDLAQVLDIYAQYVNRTILRPANLPAPLITLKTQTAL